MKATNNEFDEVWDIEINGEKCSFDIGEHGLSIIREKHKNFFLSYQDLISIADGQLTLFPLPKPKIV